jgi:hypothetical protein
MYRARHSVPALTWSASVASSAQAWANRCVFAHSRSGYGENIGASEACRPLLPVVHAVHGKAAAT